MSEETRPRLRALLEMLALFVVYVATARLGLTFDALAGVATTVWPPTGVAIAAICLGGRGRWPAVFLAAFAVNAATGIPHWTSALIAVGNTAEALLAREILVRLRWRREMERVHDVFALSVAALAATTKHFVGTRFEHDGQQLRDLPTLRARLATMSVRTEQSRALLGYTCGELEAPSATTPLFVLQTRLAALEAAVDVTDLAMKACGGADVVGARGQIRCGVCGE